MAERKEQVNGGFTPRYILEPYGGIHTRHTCPSCGKKHSFVRYIDVTTGEYVGDDVGRCNREIKCGYHNPPSNTFVKKEKVKDKAYIKEYDYISYLDIREVFKSTLNPYKSTFVKGLVRIFGKNKVYPIISRYHIGASDKWKGAVVFYQIDKEYNVRTGKIMLYDEKTIKRVKEPYSHISWIHTKYPDYNLKQVFFGEHLVEFSDTLHIVESEKTAIIMSVVKPDKIWLATGGLQNINEYRLTRISEGKKLVFHPDKGRALNLWKEKISKFEGIINYEISDFLEDKDLPDGSDLADYILKSKL